jgi:PAS domain S-box-containing protein
MSSDLHLLQVLQNRRHAIADLWFQAIAETSRAALDKKEMVDRLAELTGEAIAVFLGKPADEEQAQKIGAALADLNYVQAETLGRTLRVLGDQLMDSVPADQIRVRYPNLLVLLEGLCSGFFEEARQMILAEQETIHDTFDHELRSMEQALRQAHDELELRVKQRTAELAEANQELRREIADRQNAEIALRQSEAKYRDLVENMSEIVYAVDMEGKVTYVSPSIEPSLGYHPAEVMGRHYADFRFPPDGSRLTQGFQRLLAGEGQENEYRFLTKTGEMRWLRTSSQAIVEEGHVVGVQGLLMDVTMQKQAEQELRESEERWRLVVENAPDFVIMVDRNGRILFLNRTEEDGEISLEEVLGTKLESYLSPEHRETVERAIQKVFTTGDSQYCEAAIRRADGSETWYAAHMGAIRRNGRVVSVLLITRDITERKRVDEIKDNLIRDVSHELRSPLAKVQMSLDLLLELLEQDEVDRERASRISRLTILNVERLLDTVEGILDLSRLEAGVWAYRREQIELNALIEEAVGYLDEPARMKGLRLVANLPQDLPPVEGDREQLFHVLVNLLDNAIKFSEEGQIVVSAECGETEIEVAVRDKGQGILLDNLERVFERFFQEKTRHRGVGVGLTIAKAIVENHGGQIWTESQGRGQGTTVKFTLPIGDGQTEGE